MTRCRNPEDMSFITRGFRGKGRSDDAPPERVPPGQYATHDFPVLSAGPTPRVSLDEWRFTLADAHGNERVWDWSQLLALPAETVTVHARSMAIGRTKPSA